MRKALLLFFLLFTGSATIVAQTNAEKLEQAVKTYNALRDFEDGLSPGKVTDADIQRMKTDIATAEPLLRDVLSGGSAEEQKVARYFKANFQYELGFIYGMMGKNRDAYDVLNPIAAEYESFSSSAFPMTYRYDGKNYSISYENFSPTLAEYYTGMSEICANLSKDDEALNWARKSLNFSSTTDWYKYIAANKIMEVKKKKDTWDKEVLDMALLQMTILTRLDTSYQRTIKDNNYPTQKTSYERINKTLQNNPSLATGEYYRGEAAPLLVKLGENTKALAFYSAAISGGYADNRKSYLLDAVELAVKNSDKSTGVLALDRLVDRQSVSLSCSEWDNIVGYYRDFSESAKASSASDKARDCRKKVEDEERRRRKKERLENMDFGIYAGVYPGPMICRYGRYRDFGGVLGFTLTEKMAIEFSYKKINLNHVLQEDLTFRDISTSGFGVKWNGYKAHVAFKFVGKNSSESFYLGPLFGIVSREMEPIYASFTDETTNVYGTNYFHASEKSYEVLLNYGMMKIQKHFMVDMFMGFGVAYYQYKVNDSYYDNDRMLYDYPLLESRKATRFGPMMRMGFTLGFATKKNYWN